VRRGARTDDPRGTDKTKGETVIPTKTTEATLESTFRTSISDIVTMASAAMVLVLVVLSTIP